ncbi:MAG: hypothetical protein V4529_16570 [Gemmatimonadota bacterium]
MIDSESDDPGDGKLSKAEMANVRAFIKAQLESGKSQAEVGQLMGSSQGLISRIMSETAPHTITVGRAQRMARAAAISYEVLTRGAELAGRWETVDSNKLRGRALDVLSSLYDEEFLSAMQELPEPPGSASWTLEEWHDFLTDVRKAWKSGIFAIPGVRPPKRP